MISRRQIIWRSARPIFANFTSNESFLAVDDRSGPLFSISQGTLPWQPILCKNGKLPIFVALAFRNGMGYRYVNGCVNSGIDACMLCKNFVKFGPVTPELTRLIWKHLVWHSQQVALLWQMDRATRLSVEILQLQNIPIVWHYLCDPTFSRFYTIPECDRHTDRNGRTDTRRRHVLR